ncbi:hypothetical protein NDU88_002009, partial [Pleurodeles waltl]
AFLGSKFLPLYPKLFCEEALGPPSCAGFWGPEEDSLLFMFLDVSTPFPWGGFVTPFFWSPPVEVLVT